MFADGTARGGFIVFLRVIVYICTWLIDDMECDRGPNVANPLDVKSLKAHLRPSVHPSRGARNPQYDVCYPHARSSPLLSLFTQYSSFPRDPRPSIYLPHLPSRPSLPLPTRPPGHGVHDLPPPFPPVSGLSVVIMLDKLVHMLAYVYFALKSRVTKRPPEASHKAVALAALPGENDFPHVAVQVRSISSRIHSSSRREYESESESEYEYDKWVVDRRHHTFLCSLQPTSSLPPIRPLYIFLDTSLIIQLPMFNEKFVAQRVIDCVCALDWPRARLWVQVLDDSTDEATQRLVDTAVAAWVQRGVNITARRRTNRQGYKAGALKEGLLDIPHWYVTQTLTSPGSDQIRSVPPPPHPTIRGMIRRRKA